jgi:hypothetical protein
MFGTGLKLAENEYGKHARADRFVQSPVRGFHPFVVSDWSLDSVGAFFHTLAVGTSGSLFSRHRHACSKGLRAVLVVEDISEARGVGMLNVTTLSNERALLAYLHKPMLQTVRFQTRQADIIHSLAPAASASWRGSEDAVREVARRVWQARIRLAPACSAEKGAAFCCPERSRRLATRGITHKALKAREPECVPVCQDVPSRQPQLSWPCDVNTKPAGKWKRCERFPSLARCESASTSSLIRIETAFFGFDNLLVTGLLIHNFLAIAHTYIPDKPWNLVLVWSSLLGRFWPSFFRSH